MSYYIGYTDYPTNGERPDLKDNVPWIQSLMMQNYINPKPIVIDKEVKGGLHRVKYREQLYLYTYDGIFLERRVEGMLVYVERETNDDLVQKYYCLKHYPGLTADDWEEVGSGATVILNNPKTVANLAEREDLEVNQLTGMVTSNLGNVTVNGQGTLFMDELVVGDEIRIGNVEYYYVASIQNQLSLKTTVGTADHSVTPVPIYKVVVVPGDFVNVADARTQAEIDALVPPYPASFIWDGDQWLTIYPYGDDPRSHTQNTDTALIILGESKSTNDIWNTIINPIYRKKYNDGTTLKSASESTEIDSIGNGVEAYSSKRVAQELLKRPEVDKVNGNPLLFLNEKGQWLAPSTGPTGPTTGLTPDDIADSDTIDFYLDEETGKYKFDVIPAGATIIQTTYAELVALRNASELVNGVGYEFDYFTYHLIEYTAEYHTGLTEKIVIFANGLNTFSKRGLSRLYAQDVIEYDIDDNLVGGFSRPGNITYREDTAKGLSTYYDFRNYKFRRWAYNLPQWNAGNTYTSTSWNTYDWPIVQYPGSWFYAFSGEINKPLTSATDIHHNPNTNNYSNPFWKYAWLAAWPKYIITQPTSMQLGMSTIQANPADYTDYYTFNTSSGNSDGGLMRNIRIGKHTKPNNIVILAGTDGNNIYNNEFGAGSYDSTIGNSYNYDNKYGINFSNNVILESKNNKIDSNMQNCWFSQEFNGNQIGVQLKRVVGRFWGNNIMYAGVDKLIAGAEFISNLSFGDFSNNSVASRFTGNICSRSFSGNHLGDSANSNLFLSFFWSTTVRKTVAYCTFNQWANRNYIYGSMYGCTFKATFFDTIVGEEATKYSSTFNFNQFNGNVDKTGGADNAPTIKNYFASNSNYNTFQNYVKDVGALAIPYKTNNSIYNFAVDNLTMVTAGLTVNRVIFNQELKPYAVASNLADVIIPIPAAADGIVYKTGGVLDFVASHTEFGTEAAVVTGNITLNATGAVVAHTAQMTHNDSVAPLIGGYAIGVDTGVFHKVGGTYTTGVKNYFIFDYRSSSRINYSILQ